MRTAKTPSLACLLVLGLALPACGGGESADTQPASQSVPPERVDDLDRRVKGLEEQIDRLRKELESTRQGADREGGRRPGRRVRGVAGRRSRRRVGGC